MFVDRRAGSSKMSRRDRPRGGLDGLASARSRPPRRALGAPRVGISLVVVHYKTREALERLARRSEPPSRPALREILIVNNSGDSAGRPGARSSDGRRASSHRAGTSATPAA